MHKTILVSSVPALPPGAVALYLPVDEGQNLLRYSQQFDNAAWGKTDCAITANGAVAPDGTTAADKIALTVGAAQQLAESVTVTPGETYTYSAWVKLGTATDLKYAVYNVTGSADIIAPTAYGATGEWARYAATFTAPAGCVSVSVRPVKNAAQADGATAWLWGAQINPGPVPTAYYPTTDKQLLRDYANRSRNLLLPTIANGTGDGTISAFAPWGTGGTLSSSTEQFWQGSRSLKVVCDGTVAGQGQYYQWYTYGLSPGKTYTGSVYVKGIAGATLTINLVERTDAGTGTGGGAIVNFTATGGWDRVVATFTAGATGRCANMRVIVNGTLATTFYCDGLQLEEGSVATDWQAPPNHGILGSSLGADTNDPIWVREGMRYEADDYVKFGPITDSTGTVQPMGVTVAAFYVPSPVSAASAKSCSFSLAPTAAIYLGAVAGAPANNIITVQYDAAGSYTSWCDAAGSIAAGWHTLAVAWNGTAYDLYLDGAMLPTTTAGSPALLSPTAANCCYDGATYGPGIVRAARGIWSRTLTPAEMAQARAYLRSYLTKFGVVLP